MSNRAFRELRRVACRELLPVHHGFDPAPGSRSGFSGWGSAASLSAPTSTLREEEFAPFLKTGDRGEFLGRNEHFHPGALHLQKGGSTSSGSLAGGKQGLSHRETSANIERRFPTLFSTLPFSRL